MDQTCRCHVKDLDRGVEIVEACPDFGIIKADFALICKAFLRAHTFHSFNFMLLCSLSECNDKE